MSFRFSLLWLQLSPKPVTLPLVERYPRDSFLASHSASPFHGRPVRVVAALAAIWLSAFPFKAAHAQVTCAPGTHSVLGGYEVPNGSFCAPDDSAGAPDREPSTPYAPNVFVSFPPDAWNNWVNYEQDKNRQEIEERFGKDPAYQALLKGVWTYRRSDPKQSPPMCTATFWTRNGGVSFVHIGGKQEFTFLGFFGASIPKGPKPRRIAIDLIQSGETQKANALNIAFGSVKSMGMVLLNVGTPAILLGAIEDKQDFELKFEGAQIAYGAWHSGLRAREEMRACLQSQGFLGKD